MSGVIDLSNEAEVGQITETSTEKHQWERKKTGNHERKSWEINIIDKIVPRGPAIISKRKKHISYQEILEFVSVM